MPRLTPEFTAFFEQLTANNHKDWFDAHRKQYEEVVKKPFELLAAELLKGLAERDPAFAAQQPKNVIFRLNRDIRFAKDKSPYKNHASAYFSPGGKKTLTPGLYVHIGAEEAFCGGGCWELPPPQLFRVRQEIVYNEKEFLGILADKRFVERYKALHPGEAVKNAPKDFKEAAERLPLIKLKQYFVHTSIPHNVIFTEKLVAYLLESYDIAQPLFHFLSRAIAD